MQYEQYLKEYCIFSLSEKYQETVPYKDKDIL